MKILSKRFGIIAFAAIIALALAGCGGGSPTVESVSVTAEGGESSIKTGDMLGFSATVTGKNKPSQDVTWSVSSSSDGTGSVAYDTEISSSGFLTVDEKETAPTLYVKAVSKQDSSKFSYKAINVEVVAAAAATTETAAPKPKAAAKEPDQSSAQTTQQSNNPLQTLADTVKSSSDESVKSTTNALKSLSDAAKK